jgi:hypothetical protein
MKIGRGAWAGVGLAACLLVAGLPAYRRHVQATEARAQAEAKARFSYPRARWRLVSFQELNQVALWVSHIVVMHAGSNPAATFLRRPGWSPDPPMPSRSVDEARGRALMIADLAARSPERFEELARLYSDDVVTAADGGSLGGIRAGHLPPEYLDALAAIRPGAVSHVFQTQAGFHIIMRRPLPPDEKVAGQRLVIRYRGTGGGREGTEGTRTRAEALTFARDVARQARSGQEPFDDLVRRYSECIDVEELGDLGVRSTQDPGVWAREFERLASLRIGEVAEPLDGPIGFEVLLRRPPIALRNAKPERPAHYELPDPTGPDLEAVVRGTDGDTLAQAARDLASEAGGALRIQPAPLGQVEHRLRSLAASFEQHADDPAARVASWQGTLGQLRSTLDADQFAEFERFLNARASQMIVARTP